MTAVDLELIADGLAFPEGPVAQSDGSILVVEVAGGRVTRIDPGSGSTTVVAEPGGGPNGLAVGPEGNLLLCNNGGFATRRKGEFDFPEPFPPTTYRGGSLQRIDSSGAVIDLYTTCGAESLKAPNDLVVDQEGGVWFTDLGKERGRQLDIGSVFYGRSDGSGIEEALHPLISPNGIALAPEGDRLYVAETIPGRIWWWPVLGPGRLGRSGPGPSGGHLLHGFSGYQLPDSMAVDAAGNVCVGTLISGVVSVISPEGELLDQLGMPEFDPLVTNICFGGSDGTTAYVTSSGRGRLYRANWPRPGSPLAFAR